MSAPQPRSFVTRDLTAVENVWQAGWAKSKSGLLDRLEVDGSRITIRLRDGAVQGLTQGAFRCTSYRTGSGRRLFVIRTDDGRKVRILELEGMLSPEEWNTIAHEVLGAVPSTLAFHIRRAGVAMVLGMLLGALATGFVGGMFDLKHEQMTFGSPLGLGMTALWSVVVWFGFRLVR